MRIVYIAFLMMLSPATASEVLVTNTKTNAGNFGEKANKGMTIKVIPTHNEIDEVNVDGGAIEKELEMNLINKIQLEDQAFWTRSLSMSSTLHGGSKNRRVRREWRKLTPEIKKRVANAFWTLKKYSTKDGQKIYGKHFFNYDEIILQHACSVWDPRCNQGHMGPQFMTFHRAWLLKLELALLSVDPMIEALPYWNMALDAVGGLYHGDKEKSIFSDQYFGAFFTKESENYTVTDGLFSFWPIGQMTEELLQSIQAECITGGYLSKRITSCDNSTGPIYIRNVFKSCNPYLSRNPYHTPNIFNIQGSLEIVYSEDDFTKCTDPKHIKSWMEWMNCNEPYELKCHEAVNKGDWTACEEDPYLYGFYNRKIGERDNVNFFHYQAHVKVGHDFYDVTTSPNDAGLFTGHHANIDRSNMIWQSHTTNLAKELWKYPKDPNDLSGVNTKVGNAGPYSLFALSSCNNSDYPEYYESYPPSAWYSGTTLLEVVNANFPFFDIFPDYDGRPYGYTHQVILERTAPDSTPYTYDTLEDLFFN